MMAAIARADDAERSAMQPEPARGLFWITRLLAPVAIVGVVIAIAIGVRTRERPAPEVIALASPAVSSNAELEQPAAAPAREAYSQPAPKAGNAPLAGGGVGARKKEQLASNRALAGKSPPPEVAPSTSMASGGSALAQRGPALSHGAPAMRAEGAARGSALSGASPSMATAAPAILTYSPDRSVAWQIGAGGVIMRSLNSGPWLAQRSGATTDLLAGSAPSNDVCWVVGKSGTVVRTLDGGAHWQIVRPPARDNFTAIAATDSNNASVVAADGERFTTHDGGVTWSSP